jgi:hypothetical protein
MSDSLDKSFRFTLIIIFLDYRINLDLLGEKFTFMEPAITASHAYISANALSGRFMIYLALFLSVILIKTYFN